MIASATYRETKYCNALRRAIRHLGHSTNKQLLDLLRDEYPELSATTVHRATARLAQRGEIGIAPSSLQGIIRYDAQSAPHDHFHCSTCDKLCDTTIKDEVLPIIDTAMKDCSISGNIVITGTCKECSHASI